MNYNKIYAFSLAIADVGSRNQILGALNALAELTGSEQSLETAFVLPEGINHYSEVKNALHFSLYKDYSAFKNVIFKMLDHYFAHINFVPRIFLTVYNLSESANAGENVDMLCRAIKEYYAAHDLGFIFTAVLTSRLHNYKYVDLINVPKHVLTLSSRIRLLQKKKLRKKVLITLGTINNFSRKKVTEKFNELKLKLAETAQDVDLKPHLQKLQTFINTPKKVVFCLGGRVDGSEIVFDLDYAQKIFSDALRLVKHDYAVAFVNGFRTPSNVSDFLFEQSLTQPKILFHNCKKIVAFEDEKTPQNWRLYFGKFENEFKIQQKLGNIYPGILGFDNTLVVHTLDSYAACETTNAAIPTAISRTGLYVSPSLRYDCHNLYKLLCPKYAIDWDEFVNLATHMNMEPQDLSPLILSSPLRVFTETLLNKVSLAWVKEKSKR